MLGWLANWLDGWLLGWFIGWFVGELVGWWLDMLSYTSPSPKRRESRWWVGWCGVGGALEGVD